VNFSREGWGPFSSPSPLDLSQAPFLTVLFGQVREVVSAWKIPSFRLMSSARP
jgi:hypothetical protein